MHAQRNKIKRISLFACVLFLGFLGYWEYKTQEYNWDMIPYMAVVLMNESNNIDEVHHVVYKTIKEQVPAGDYQLLIYGNVEMRKKSAESADYFKKQLPFYVVKPLYTRLVYWFYKMGFPLIKATVLPSVICYFFIGIVLYTWLSKYLNTIASLLIVLLLMIYKPFLAIGNISTPDCLSALILLIVFYFLAERKSLGLIFGLLAVAVFARLDNVIPAIAVLILLRFSAKWKTQLSNRQFFFAGLVICVCYLFVAFKARPFGWNILFYPSFLSHLNPTYNSSIPFSFSAYSSVVQTQIFDKMAYSELPIFFLLAMALLFDRNSSKLTDYSFERMLVGAVLLIIITRFLLQPIIADRFYVAYYATIFLLLVKRLVLKFELASKSI
ncbi:MAG TPA: hypothetical protein VKR32_11465 [Puia sp.]|nr:hypothetical protein [Puia sp.]